MFWAVEEAYSVQHINSCKYDVSKLMLVIESCLLSCGTLVVTVCFQFFIEHTQTTKEQRKTTKKQTLHDIKLRASEKMPLKKQCTSSFSGIFKINFFLTLGGKKGEITVQMDADDAYVTSSA